MNETFEVAERQHGLMTRAQLTGIGLPHAQIQRRVSAGILARVFSETPTRHGIVVHGSVVERHEVRVVDSIPCVSAARTLLDCAICVDDETIEAAFESARRMGLVTPAKPWNVRSRVGRAPPHSGACSSLGAARRGVPARGELARLLRSSRLPGSMPQFRVGPYRLDRAWPDRRVAVEADGFEHHGRRLAWKRDRQRVATIEAMGWRVVHVTWADVVERPAETLDRVAHALGTIAA